MRDEDKTKEQLIAELRELRQGRATADLERMEEPRARAGEHGGPKRESIPAPEEDRESLELADILDIGAVQSLMDDFYRLAHIPMSLIDIEGRVLVGVGWQEICTRFHRAHPQTCRHCIESDTQLSTDIPPGEFKLYKCKNHMWDIATPVMVRGKHVGSIFSGQFFFDDETPDYELFRSQARQYGFNESDYLAALERVPRLSREAVETGMAFFMKLAQILSQMSYTNVKLAKTLSERKRMEEELRKSEVRFRLLSETAGQLLASRNPQRIVNELCQKIMEHLDCHAFFNFLVDEQVGKLHLNTCGGISEEEIERIEWLDYGVAVCGCAAQTGARIVAEDIFHTPDIRTELVKSYGIQAYACHPLTARGEVIGTLSFGTKTRAHFSSEDLALMKTVTDQVAVAMERVRLIEELRESRDELELRVQKRTAELKRYMARLEQSNQALQDFVSIASHDLQEPLRKVKTFGERLDQKCGDSMGKDGRDYLDRMLRATERMQSLLKSLLDYSRVTSRAELFQEIELSALIGEVLSDLEVSVERSGGKVEWGDLPMIQADPSQMRQLFQNLIGNGLKFHRKGEKPVVLVRSTTPDEHTLEIVVEDNGIGFDMKHLDRIFAPFQRLHGRSEFEGTGMGLAICKKIVERHGGSIAAESIPGRGSTFIVRLPLRQAQSSEEWISTE